MQDFVSTPRIGVWPLAAALSLAWPALILHGFPWTSLVWLSLAFSVALWAGTSRPNSQPCQVRVAMPAPKAVL